MTAPKIAIGCPVRNRAWVLPEYLAALERLRYQNTQFIFLENDSTDETMPLLWNWEVPAEVMTITTSADYWQRGDYAHNQYANLASVRNQFLEMFLRTDADYLLSVDSDVIVPPDIVERLLDTVHLWCGDKVDVIIGAAISNVPDKPLDGMTPGNFMFKYETSNAYFHMLDYPMKGAFPCGLIGAVYLIPRSAIVEGARYAPHGQGEDIPFCQAAQRLGYRLLVNMDVKCEHRMVRPE